MGKYKTQPEIPLYERWEYWNKILNIARNIYGKEKVSYDESPYLAYKLSGEKRKKGNIERRKK